MFSVQGLVLSFQGLGIEGLELRAWADNYTGGSLTCSLLLLNYTWKASSLYLGATLSQLWATLGLW